MFLDEFSDQRMFSLRVTFRMFARRDP
jgi:hypothetical protein